MLKSIRKLSNMKLERIRVSSSISNFREKLHNKFDVPEWNWWKDRNKPTAFMGLYHYRDYLRFIWHRGPKKVVWAGSDILNLRDSLWLKLIRLTKAKHYCENEVERQALCSLQIYADIQPCLVEDLSGWEVSYKHSSQPHVWLCAHPQRETEYGIGLIEQIVEEVPEVTFHIYGVPPPELWFDNSIKEMRNLSHVHERIIYHGKVSEKQLNKEIKSYQGALRLNKFDGFSDVVNKGFALGQYIYSEIRYPYSCRIQWLKDLKNKKRPDTEAREYWLRLLKEAKDEVVNNW